MGFLRGATTHHSDFSNFSVELEYLFHRVGPRCLLTTWLCQAAESAHAKIRDCRSGRCDPTFRSLNTVVHVDDAEIELGFWMMSRFNGAKSAALCSGTVGM